MLSLNDKNHVLSHLPKYVILSTNYSGVILFIIQFCSESNEDSELDTEVRFKA